MKMIKVAIFLFLGLFSVAINFGATESPFRRSYYSQEEERYLNPRDPSVRDLYFSKEEDIYSDYMKKLGGFATLDYILLSRKPNNVPVSPQDVEYLSNLFNNKFPISNEPFFWAGFMEDIKNDPYTMLRRTEESLYGSITRDYNANRISKNYYDHFMEYYNRLSAHDFRQLPQFEFNLPSNREHRKYDEEDDVEIEMPETPEQTEQKLRDISSYAYLISSLRYIVKRKGTSWRPFTSDEVQKLATLYANNSNPQGYYEYIMPFLSAKTVDDALYKLYMESDRLAQTLFKRATEEGSIESETLEALRQQLYSETRPRFPIDQLINQPTERESYKHELRVLLRYCEAIGTLRYIIAQYVKRSNSWQPLSEDDIDYLADLYFNNFSKDLPVFNRKKDWKRLFSEILAAPSKRARDASLKDVIQRIESRLLELVNQNVITEEDRSEYLKKTERLRRPLFNIYLPSYGYLELTTREPKPTAQNAKASKTSTPTKENVNKPSAKTTTSAEIKAYSMQELVTLMTLFADEPQATAKNIRNDKQKMKRLEASTSSSGMAGNIARAILKSIGTITTESVTPEQKKSTPAPKPAPKGASPKPASAKTPTPSTDKPKIAPADPNWLRATALAVGRNFRSIKSIQSNPDQIEAIRAAARENNQDAIKILNKLGIK